MKEDDGYPIRVPRSRDVADNLPETRTSMYEERLLEVKEERDALHTALVALRSQRDEELAHLRVLFDFYEKYMYQTSFYEPTREQRDQGFASLVTTEDSATLESALNTIELHEPEIREVLQGWPPSSGPYFLLWSNKHQAWWRRVGEGCTTVMDEAGRYTQTEALERVLQSAYLGNPRTVTCAVVAPPVRS